MKKILFLLLCVLSQTFIAAHGAETKKFAYCGGNIKFYIPSFFDKKSIEKQSEPVSCKYGLTLKSRAGGKLTHVEISQGSTRIADEANFDDEYLSQFKMNYPHRLHFLVTKKTKNGDVAILTFYWFDNSWKLKAIEKDIYFGKEDTVSATASYTANPDDTNDILFLSALEQLFLSAEIDW